MSRLTSFLPAVALAMALIGTGGSTGCASSSNGGELDSAIAAYDDRDYETANHEARALAAAATGRERDQAAYIAALSAYRLGRTSEAETDLVIAVRSSDAETRAKAQAMLGIVRLDQERLHEASSLLTDAADDLEGEDATRADQLARRASSGMSGTSSTSGASSNRDGRSTGAHRTSSGSFTLQIGAFRERSRAESAARRVGADGRVYGEIEILPQVDDRGRRLYHVQLGRFNTRQAASAARQRLGRPEFIVVAASRS